MGFFSRTPKEALSKAQREHPPLAQAGRDPKKDLGREVYSLLEPHLPASVKNVFASGSAVIGEIGILSPAAYANRISKGKYWIEVYSGLAPFFDALSRAMYSSMNMIGAGAAAEAPATSMEQADLAMERILRHFATTRGIVASTCVLSESQEVLARKLAESAESFVVAHELGHVLIWQQEGSKAFSPEHEILADKIALSIVAGIQTEGTPPPLDVVSGAYAGAEFALRVFSALNRLGYEFRTEDPHPYPKDRLESLRQLASGMFGNLYGFIYVSSLAFSHDFLLERMEQRVTAPADAGIQPSILRSVTPIRGLALLAPWITMYAHEKRSLSDAAKQFVSMFDLAGPGARTLAKNVASMYVEGPLSVDEKMLSQVQLEKAALRKIIVALPEPWSMMLTDAVAEAENAKAASFGPPGTHDVDSAKYTAAYTEKACLAAGSPDQFKPGFDALQILLRPDGPDWVIGSPDVAAETPADRGRTIKINAPFKFSAMHAEHGKGCACGCKGKCILVFMLSEEVPAVLKVYNSKSLIEAVRKSDAASVAHFLELGVDLGAKDSAGATALMYAAQEGMADIVKLLLDHGVDVELNHADGRTPLMFATSNGHAGAAVLLLDSDADIDAKTTSGWTALLYAAWLGKHEMVKLLLDRGADINAKANNGATALLLAMANHHEDLAKYFLERGANPDAQIHFSSGA